MPATGKRLMIISDRPALAYSALSENESKVTRKALGNVNFDYVYVTTAIKCIPRKNPLKNQIEECEWRLREEIEFVKPDVIIAVGRHAAMVFNLTGSTENIRNQVYEVVTFPWKPKLIVTLPFSKVLEDYRYERQFETDFMKAERFAYMENIKLYDYKMFESADEFGQWVDTLLANYVDKIVVAADIETTGLDPRAPDAKVRTIAFSWAEAKGRVVPYELDPDGYRPHLKRLFESDTRFIFHNAAFDVLYIRIVLGIEVKVIVGDTWLMVYLVDPLRSNFKLKPLAQEYTELGSYDTEVKNGEYATIDINILATYNICDVDVTRRIYSIYKKDIDRLGMSAINEILAKFIHSLCDMHEHGVLIDQDFVAETTPKLATLVAGYEAELQELAGGEYDWASSYDMEHVLYDVMRLPRPASKTATAADDNCLDILNTPFTQTLRKHRKATKLLGTYMLGYFSKMDDDGRLRAHYWLTTTRTGRLSSSDPNYQNLPGNKLDKDDPCYEDINPFKIKDAVIAPPGWVLLSVDQSQIEMRVAAIVSGDKELAKIYQQKLDFHSMSAKVAFGIDKNMDALRQTLIEKGMDPASEEFQIDVLRAELKQIKAEHKEERDRSKSVSFGVLYGMSEYGLKFDLDKKTRRKGKEWPLSECKAFIDRFHAKFPTLHAWLKATQKQARRDGYVTTIFGRRRPLPGFKSNDDYYRKKAKREAINTPIQSPASDIMVLGITNVRDRIDRTRAKIVATVHDSLVLEVREDYVDEAVKIIKDALQNPLFNGKPLPFITVPLVADVSMGTKYGSMKEIA